MVKKQVADLPAIVSKDEAYQNAIKNSDARNARVESDRATMQAILDSMSTTIELYKAVNENPALCRWIKDMVFANTYQTSPPAKEDQPDFDRNTKRYVIKSTYDRGLCPSPGARPINSHEIWILEGSSYAY